MKFELPKLPYKYDSLEPYIDEQTMKIHHDKHHQTYTDNFNKAFEKYPGFLKKSVEEILIDLSKIPEEIRTAVKNNGGGYYNHLLFWQILSGDKKNQKFEGKVAEAVEKQFDGFDNFKILLSDAAMKRFGSGWAWLVYNPILKKLEVYSTSNQDCPLSEGKIPLLLIDVWEHAFYLHYLNKKADYVSAIWNVINWKKVNELYEKALKS